MSEIRIVVIGASAGGVAALKTLVGDLPVDFPAAVFIVLHVPAGSISRLPEILNKQRRLPAAHAADGEGIRPGRIYIAPPDHHLLLEDHYLRVLRGPKENRQRPAVDPLFRSAALTHGPQVIGVILTGALDDGTSGLKTIKARGGIAIVQDPVDAETPDMPRSALAHVDVDDCLPLRAIGPRLVELVSEPVPAREDLAFVTGPPPLTAISEAAAMGLADDLESEARLGAPSAFTCPECSGSLWELDDGGLIRYRCRVGHAYTAQTMLTEQAQAVERALWVALRLVQENASASRRVASRAAERGHPLVAQRFLERAAELDDHAKELKATLLHLEQSAASLEEGATQPID